MMLKVGSHRGDKLHRSSSSPEINVVGPIKVLSFNLHHRRWVERWISKVLIFISQGHRPTTWEFFYIGKDIKIKYTSNNCSFYLYHMKKNFPLFSKLLKVKKCINAKCKISEEWNSSQNYESFITVSVFGKWWTILIFKIIKISLWSTEMPIYLGQGRSSHRSFSVKVGVLKNFVIFRGNHLCGNLFLIKL